jgi:stage V sporulation protein G
MEISEVRVRLVSNQDDRLKAFCSMTFDGEFVVRDIKIIEGTGGLFVAMPSRKMSDHCRRCGGKNYLRAKFCCTCGSKLPEDRVHHDPQGHLKLHADIAHPINADCRRKIQDSILRAFDDELERSKLPGYKPADLDEDDFHADDLH